MKHEIEITIKELKNLGCLINIAIFWFGIFPILVFILVLISFILSMIFNVSIYR